MLKKLFFVFLTLFLSVSLSAQEKEQDSIVKARDSVTFIQDTVPSKREIKRAERQARRDSISSIKKEFNPLAPSKAAFYSAVLPGLGQMYNKSYWKVPIVYGAIGTGIYFYVNNNNQYQKYRDAYKIRLAGFVGQDEFWDVNGSGITDTPDVSTEALQDAQEFYQRNKDLALLITVGLYVLNIIDANVDAHLKQYNVNEDLSFRPILFQNDIDSRSHFGFSITYNF